MVNVPETPVELGFDRSQLPNWRPYQRQTVKRIVDAPRGSTLIISAPTGSGKSALALAAARLTAGKVTVLTHQKALQAQYMETLINPPLVMATGRDNHLCVLEGQPPGLTAAHAPCVDGMACKYMRAVPVENIGCPYYRQKAIAEAAPIRVLNYPMFFLLGRQGSFKSSLLVCDEGHRLDKALLTAMTVRFSGKQLDFLVKAGQSLPRLTDGVWLKGHAKMDEWLTGAGRYLSTLLKSDTATREQRDIARPLLQSVGSLKDMQRCTVMWQERTHTWIPILSEEIAERLLLSVLTDERKLVVMSATVYDPKYTADRLGLKRSDVTYVEVPSSFPVERRLVYVRPVERMNMVTSKDPLVLRELTDTIDGIIDQFNGRKGVVHCGSFKLGQEIANRSRHIKRMILAESGNNRIEEFRSSTDGVYVSPSAYEGYDLKDDLCRFSIVAKLSWPNRGDPVVAAQLAHIKGFNEYEAASALIQAAGRGMRHEGDWCTTFILDGTVHQLMSSLSKQGVSLPKWFTEAIRY